VALFVFFSSRSYSFLVLTARASRWFIKVVGLAGEPEARAAASSYLRNFSPAWLTASRLWKTFSIQ